MSRSLTRKTAVLYSLTMLTTAGLFFNHLLHLRAAQAQTASSANVCVDPWLNALIPARKTALGRPNIDNFGPSIDGFGTQGECNPKLYNNGSWNSDSQLQGYVDNYLTHRTAGVCRDSTLTQAIRDVWGKAPRGFGESQDCNMYLYGAGSWSTYADLLAKVRANKSDMATANLDYSIGGLIRPSNPGKVIQPTPVGMTVSGNNIILNGGGNIILNGGGSIILNGGGNIVAQGGLNIVAQGAGNIVAQGAGNYHTLAVGPGVPAKLIRAGTVSIILPVGK